MTNGYESGAFSTVSGGPLRAHSHYILTIYTLENESLYGYSNISVPKVQEAFDEQGQPADKAATDKRASAFLKELLWCIEANERMKGPDILNKNVLYKTRRFLFLEILFVLSSAFSLRHGFL